MFADSQGKVVSLFMDTLQFFIKEYNPMLRDWLYTLLIRLLHRQSHEVLGSHQKAIQETLFVLRSHFPLNIQFGTCCRFIMDNTQALNSKVKVCLLEYLKDLILMMSPDAIASPTSEMNHAISRIISWSTEPNFKHFELLILVILSVIDCSTSFDIIQMASRVIIKLYDLNASSFSGILQSLPRSSQDRASEILKTYQKTTTGGGRMDSNLSSSSWKPPSIDQTDRMMSPTDFGQAAYPLDDDNNLSPEAVNNLIRQTSEGIQSLTCGISSGIPTPQRRVSESAVMHSPATYSPRIDSQLSQPVGRTESPAAVLRTMQPSNIISSPGSIQSPLLEPSPVTNSHEQRKSCMLKLIKLLRDGVIQDWDEYFKPTLLILLETLGDDGASSLLFLLLALIATHAIFAVWFTFSPQWTVFTETRALALKVLQELVRTKHELFHEFACLFVIKVLEACRDGEKTVNRAAEECSKTVAQCLPPDLCLSVLTPLINDWSLQINLPAVKMQEQVVRNAPVELISQVVDTIIPGLIVKRLLKLYIDREQASNATSHESLGARS
ncbi:unnamed protein product [Echinostoma caproni]|uniref:FAT domain-containing protein n=1 Tax=Echinostoma caproni TaxID=27848 RepID=A0A183AMF6_9TREM|nr:unnamed protein product [Echinostoma caproni]